MKIKTFSLSTAIFLTTTSVFGGTLTFVSDQGSLNANDQVLWSQLGAVGDNPASPANAASTNGVSVTADNGDGFTIYQQGITFGGNFAPDDILLGQNINTINTQNDPLTLTFGPDVFGAGMQVMETYYGAFTIQLQVYDDLNNLLGTQSFDGNANDNSDNSAIFVGALDTTAEIGKMVLTVTEAAGTGGFAGDTLFLNDASGAVPEPASAVLLLSGFAGLVLYRRRKAA